MFLQLNALLCAGLAVGIPSISAYALRSGAFLHKLSTVCAQKASMQVSCRAAQAGAVRSAAGLRCRAFAAWRARAREPPRRLSAGLTMDSELSDRLSALEER